MAHQYKIYYWIILGIIVTHTACSKLDSNPPELILIQPVLVDTMLLFTGDSLNYEAEVSDDRDLSNFVFMLAPNFPFQLFQENAWDTLVQKTVLGQTGEINIRLGTIPKTAKTGLYEFATYATDMSGNRSERQTIAVKMTNKTDTIAPTVDFIAPIVGSSNPIIILSENIVYIIKSTDNNKLGKSLIRVFEPELDSITYQASVDDFEGLGEGTASVTVPSPEMAGIYRSVFIIADEVNNQTVVEFDLEVR